MRRLDVDRHLADVVVDVRVADFALRGQVVYGEVVGRLGRTQKGGGVVRDEARLPPFLEVLAGVAYQVSVGNEGALEMYQMAHGRAHPDGVPPRAVRFDRGV